MEITKNLYDNLVYMVSLFNKNKSFELEAKCKHKLTHKQFTQVLKYMRSIGYTEEIHQEVLDVFVIIDNESYRLSIQGINNIHEYCRSNNIDVVSGDDIEILSKKRVQGIKPLLFDAVNFTFDLKNEVKINDDQKNDILGAMSSLDKGFRLKKRFSYTEPSKTMRFDLTLVRSSHSHNGSFIRYKTFSDSGVTNAQYDYEIEIEIVKRNTKEMKSISKAFIANVVEVYSVIEGVNAVISQIEKQQVLENYLSLVFGKSEKFNLKKALQDVKQKPKLFFVGPQPVTLEQKNVIKDKLGVVTIQNNYTVTEKADGERMLLFVNNNGKCYLINNRLDIMYTGIKLNSIVNSVYDGEFITKTITGETTKVFAIFDAYWDNGKAIRSLPLVEAGAKQPCRVQTVYTFVKKVKDNFASNGIILYAKEFLYGDNIFEQSTKLLDAIHLGKFNYSIDGLIYTPQKLPVGGSFEHDKPNISSTWNKVFKWKPPSDNTIDFLVNLSTTDYTSVKGTSYRVLNMAVGYNPLQWEPITPRMALEGNIKRTSTYIAKKFVPGDINDDTFAQCFMKVDEEGDKIYCCNGDEIIDNTIIEFAYEDNNQIPYPLRWKPLRVREDKTEMLRKFGLSGTANDYGTAMNIWKSIRYPVTKMIIRGDDIVDDKDIVDDDVYYYRSTSRDKFASKPMLDFHNYWIKSTILFSNITKANTTTLLDVSCGKGGDIPKWIDNKVTNVLGIDISKDNIENPIDGAYARTIQNKRYDPSKHKFIYVTLDSSKKITKDYIETISNDDDRTVCRNIWSFGKTESLADVYGFANQGFDVVSCQFSIHYFFENESKLDNLIWNINQHIKPGGVFIGTCLDGFKVKDKLKSISFGEHMMAKVNDRVLWNIKKSYHNEDNVQFGETIEVFMESIGKVSKEYLVNFDTLTEKLLRYNIRLLTQDEASAMNLPSSKGSFKDAYQAFNETSHDDTNKFFVDSIKTMSSQEKEYSFMNIWFVFIKDATLPIESKKVTKKIIKKK